MAERLTLPVLPLREVVYRDGADNDEHVERDRHRLAHVRRAIWRVGWLLLPRAKDHRGRANHEPRSWDVIVLMPAV